MPPHSTASGSIKLDVGRDAEKKKQKDERRQREAELKKEEEERRQREEKIKKEEEEEEKRQIDAKRKKDEEVTHTRCYHYGQKMGLGFQFFH